VSHLTIRPAHERDHLDLLAALDSAAPLRGDVLVAESCGRLVAALELESGRSVADPFERTADVVELLRMRARGAPGAFAATQRIRRLLPQLRAA